MRLFVSNLHFSTTHAEVKEYLGKFGTVDSVTMMHARTSGRSLGWGFIEMPNKIEALVAIASLDGTVWQGRRLIVRVAKRQAPREAVRRGDRVCPAGLALGR